MHYIFIFFLGTNKQIRSEPLLLMEQPWMGGDGGWDQHGAGPYSDAETGEGTRL